MHSLVLMSVVWICLRCHGQPEHITAIETTRAECLRLRQGFIAENRAAKRAGWPTWAPVSAMCMVLP